MVGLLPFTRGVSIWGSGTARRLRFWGSRDKKEKRKGPLRRAFSFVLLRGSELVINGVSLRGRTSLLALRAAGGAAVGRGGNRALWGAACLWWLLRGSHFGV
jgi:hypothetical protein